MTNLIPFRSPGSGAADVGSGFFADPPLDSHAVQFYESEVFLYERVSEFLGAGIQTGDRVVAIATADHREELTRRLQPQGITRAISEGQVVLLDAREMLSKFMIGEMPDPDLFRDAISRVLGTARGGAGPRVRAYGEMVDLLWRDGNSRAAIRLEELWNEIGKAHSFSLLCAYVMGNFYKEGDAARFMEICRNHSHVIPTEDFTQLDDPHARLREISLLQQRARSLETEIHHREELENALRDALRERSRVEDELRSCVKREQDARERAEASDAYKEMFLGILGHDLRNPLNTVLTTARLMKMRGEAPTDNDRRFDRIISSGVRMQRMIDQLLDVTRARCADGIPVKRTQRYDLAQLTLKIVDELRAAHPLRKLEVQTDGGCLAYVDADRFEQVISNLLGNAIMHGDPERPITVVVARRERVASVAVHNFGPAIDPAFMPMLFDPFKRGELLKGRLGGLGLGLYITERIVSAHGGKIEVASSPETGTRFEVVVPVFPHV
jgi:signal transduction histidine kinase